MSTIEFDSIEENGLSSSYIDSYPSITTEYKYQLKFLF